MAFLTSKSMNLDYAQLTRNNLRHPTMKVMQVAVELPML